MVDISPNLTAVRKHLIIWIILLFWGIVLLAGLTSELALGDESHRFPQVDASSISKRRELCTQKTEEIKRRLQNLGYLN